MKKTNLIALGLVTLITLWMLTGLFIDRGPATLQENAKNLFKVNIINSKSQAKPVPIMLYGETEAIFKTTIFSEIQAKVQEIKVKEGDILKKGQEMIILDVKHYQNRLNNAQLEKDNQELKLKAAQKLFKLGLSSEVQFNEAKAAQKAAAENLQKAQSDFDNVSIKAPFNGRVENIFIKIGEIAGMQKKIMDFASLETSIVVAYLPEKYISEIKIGAPVLIRLVDERKFKGHVMFISNVAEGEMRSFRVEVQVDESMAQHEAENSSFKTVPSGMTAEIQIFSNEQESHKIPSSALSINENGVIGIKIVNEQNRVSFKEVRIITQDENGMWVVEKNSPQHNLKIITIGHAYVSEGAEVEAIQIEANDENH